MPQLPQALSRLLGNRSGATTWGAARPHTASLSAAALAEVAEAAARHQRAEYNAAVRRIIEQGRGLQ